jgi:hypothetical protein
MKRQVEGQTLLEDPMAFRPCIRRLSLTALSSRTALRRSAAVHVPAVHPSHISRASSATDSRALFSGGQLKRSRKKLQADILVVWTAGKFSMDMGYMRRLGVLSTAEVPLKALSMQISKRFPCSNN